MAIPVIILVSKGSLNLRDESACGAATCKWHTCKSHINTRLFSMNAPQIIYRGFG